MRRRLRREGLAACLAASLPWAALSGAAAAGPLDLSPAAPQLGPLGNDHPGLVGAALAPDGKAKPAAPPCAGFAEGCATSSGAIKPPPAFEYGLQAEAGIGGSNHGFGTEIGAAGWIRPTNSNMTLSVTVTHEQWNGRYGRN